MKISWSSTQRCRNSISLSKHRFFDLMLEYAQVLYYESLSICSMGEGIFLLKRGYGFMGGVPPPFDTSKMCTYTYDIKLKLSM